jgi:hypothetical protein
VSGEWKWLAQPFKVADGGGEWTGFLLCDDTHYITVTAGGKGEVRPFQEGVRASSTFTVSVAYDRTVLEALASSPEVTTLPPPKALPWNE